MSEFISDIDEIVARIRAGDRLLVAVGERRPWYFDAGPAVDGRAVKRLEREGRLDTSPCLATPPAPAILTVPPRIPGLSKDEHAAVEAMFAQELPGAKLAMVRPAVGRSLESKGFAERSEVVIGNGNLAVKVPAYHLTQAGHFAYCSWAAEQPDDDQPDAEQIDGEPQDMIGQT